MDTIQSTLSTDPDMPGSFLFDSIVFGPVYSRRLGSSLGINLLPANKKVCTFNCIYCECGFTHATTEKSKLPSTTDVITTIENSLILNKKEGKTIDHITFAGNGEPTIHPNFLEIIEKIIVLKQKYFPDSKIAALTNGTQLHKPDVVKALSLVDNPIIKLDSAIEETVHIMDSPLVDYNLKNVIEAMIKMNSNFILQTMFIRAECKGVIVDNTTDFEVNAWLDVLKRIKPRLVQIYTISRIPASISVEKINAETLEAIALKVNKLGIKTLVTP
ncbi:MAG TPA: radical SAM protein [Salinivirgaceae bacterium]|nr:radical SAM protein [Salinivirgaceae bacterium]